MSVERAGPSDVPELASLLARVGIDGWGEVAVERELERADSIVLCHRSDAGLEGFAMARWVVDECELLAIGVDPSLRRRGVGRQLLAAVERAAFERGVVTMFLEVRASNLPARRLYESAGYELTGLRRRYYRDAEDAALYLRRLAPALPRRAER
ncbi:MAG: ribosomal protein S18-alanine N-acetyltransferase [Deltaproteobacteria bacterium]|nr:ribosomal protein S18-alanine N-acetyltransferase [Deltaproteobacteria bacterium]